MGQGQPLIVLSGKGVRQKGWEAALAGWAEHFQVWKPILAPDSPACDARMRVSDLQAGLRERLPEQPLYVVGLHGGCELACQLAAQWHPLSGVVLLEAENPACTRISQLNVPLLTIWQQAADCADAADTAIALAQGKEHHEWLVIPPSSGTCTIGQIILRWLQSRP